MAEKAAKRISSTARSCDSKRPAAKAVRVVCISNPTMVKTSASEFRAVVQSLTGRKRSSASRSKHEEMNLDPDDQNNRQVKIPKLNEDGLQCLNDMKGLESARIVDNSTVSHCCAEKDHDEIRIFEELELQPIQNPDYVFSHRGFETVESIENARNLVVDLFSPSILFSEFGTCRGHGI